MHPDDVASGRLFDDLCEGLARRGWEVTAFPSNRSAWDVSRKFSAREAWRGINFRRIWRLPIGGASALGRLINAAWINLAWVIRAFGENPDALIIGTDPVLSVLVARVWRFMHPSVAIAHWCHDLYPDAAVADGMLTEHSKLVRLINPLLKSAYASCDLVVDIGPCMRERMCGIVGSRPGKKTITPWAIIEQIDRPFESSSLNPKIREIRTSLFGTANLAIMYSGNFGKAHSGDEFLKLARILRGQSIHFAFGARGSGLNSLKSNLSVHDKNITFCSFAPEEDLLFRLTVADIHLVSLKKDWTGTVVPSKFFGCLAVGRPAIFAGSPDSSIARWIKQHKVGWVINDERTIRLLAKELVELSHHPESLYDLQNRCREVYWENFNKDSAISQWDASLRENVKKRKSF